jgi:hypothetical protein
MKTDTSSETPINEEVLPEGYKKSSWPHSGRLVFGPWCLLGAWPAVFGVMEKDGEPKQEKE